MEEILGNTELTKVVDHQQNKVDITQKQQTSQLIWEDDPEPNLKNQNIQDQKSELEENNVRHVYGFGNKLYKMKPFSLQKLEQYIDEDYNPKSSRDIDVDEELGFEEGVPPAFTTNADQLMTERSDNGQNLQTERGLVKKDSLSLYSNPLGMTPSTAAEIGNLSSRLEDSYIVKLSQDDSWIFGIYFRHFYKRKDISFYHTLCIVFGLDLLNLAFSLLLLIPQFTSKQKGQEREYQKIGTQKLDLPLIATLVYVCILIMLVKFMVDMIFFSWYKQLALVTHINRIILLLATISLCFFLQENQGEKQTLNFLIVIQPFVLFLQLLYIIPSIWLTASLIYWTRVLKSQQRLLKVLFNKKIRVQTTKAVEGYKSLAQNEPKTQQDYQGKLKRKFSNAGQSLKTLQTMNENAHLKTMKKNAISKKTGKPLKAIRQSRKDNYRRRAKEIMKDDEELNDNILFEKRPKFDKSDVQDNRI